MRHAFVLGAGRMGTGIAHALLLAGCTVALADESAVQAESGVVRVTELIHASASRGVLNVDPDVLIARLSSVESIDSAGGSFLVIEAVPEDPALKVRVLAAVERVVDRETIIASNTSSISVSELAAALRRPNRFLGMHFFNPVAASSVVELVVGVDTDGATVAAARGLVADMRKTAIVVRDSPGFASSRLGVLLGIEAIRMVEAGVASPADIDAAMTLGYRHPVGPLRLTDMVGLDVRLGVAEYLTSTLGERFEPPTLMRDMVARGELGQKSGRGFYEWPASGG